MSSSAAFFSLFLRQVAQMAGPDNACFALPFHLFPPLWSPPDWLLLPITMRVEGRAQKKKRVWFEERRREEKNLPSLRVCNENRPSFIALRSPQRTVSNEVISSSVLSRRKSDFSECIFDSRSTRRLYSLSKYQNKVNRNANCEMIQDEQKKKRKQAPETSP